MCRKSLAELSKELAAGAERVRAGRDKDFQKMMGLATLLPTFLLRPREPRRGR